MNDNNKPNTEFDISPNARDKKESAWKKAISSAETGGANEIEADKTSEVKTGQYDNSDNNWVKRMYSGTSLKAANILVIVCCVVLILLLALSVFVK